MFQNVSSSPGGLRDVCLETASFPKRTWIFPLVGLLYSIHPEEKEQPPSDRQDYLWCSEKGVHQRFKSSGGSKTMQREEELFEETKKPKRLSPFQDAASLTVFALLLRPIALLSASACLRSEMRSHVRKFDRSNQHPNPPNGCVFNRSPTYSGVRHPRHRGNRSSAGHHIG